MPLSQKAAAAVMDMILRDQANPYTYSGTGNEELELALFITGTTSVGTDPGDSLADGDASVSGEVSGTSYDRTIVEFGTAATVADPSVIQNTAAITFPTAGSGGWATGSSYINGWSLYDVNATPSSRVSIWTGAFDLGKNVDENDTVTIATGNLTLRLT